MGEGWARLEKIPTVAPPPSRPATDIFSIFKGKGDNATTAQEIRQKASAVFTPAEIRLGLDQLRRRKIIVTTEDNFTYELNPRLTTEADKQYYEQLQVVGKA